ncbi:phosphoenolpyruvate synthase [Nocardiopsis gilva YIM 90087]|uniref:Phosphoenolpyruvate synthase n=2 Tax=Nocardiopsis gilva TaxID=280236 RepID=A0A223SDL4_9ACTN|nr:phosphoenolpyruvate synthase [Nocardiopsis gilva YIM 90087]
MTDRGPAQRFAAPIDAFGRDDLDRAGGKGANLGELVRNGFLVPGGFIVTTDAYTAAVERTDLAERIAEHVAGLRATDAGGDTAPATDGAALRAAFDAAAVPDDIRAAIADAYAELGGGPVAVRSSATAEDLPGAAFAGQQDTYLNIIGERAVIDAVARCWASLWTDRAIAYRRHRGIDSGEVSIAVVVQSMVEAESAGVMFSANPVTGDRGEVVIDASSGLGEAVVSGLVTPDHYVLDTSGKLKEWRGGRREVVIHGTADGGVTHGSEPAPPPDKPQLPAPVLRELASLGTRVAAHFGRPQDMEWAYADGEVRLLQARPMTAVPPPPVRLNPVQRRIGSMVMDYATQRPYPLDMTTWLAHGPVKMVAVMMASVGIRADLPKSFPEEDGVVTRYIPPMPRPTLKVLAAPFSIAARARRHDPARWTNDARFLAFERGIDELNDRDLEALTWAELLRVPRTAMDLLGEVTDLRVDYLPAALVALLRLRLALARLGLTTLMADLLIAPTRTTDCNRALEALAEQVRRSPRLYADFARLDPDELAELVAGTTAPATEYEHTEAPDDPDLARFRADFRAFLAEYGHRETASPILISPPTWIESPATVLGLIRMLLDQDTAGAAPGDRSRAAEERLLAHPRLRRAGRRARMMRRVEAARVGMALREDTHFYFTRSMPPLRRSLMEMGRRLRDAGVLRTPGDVFHLRFEELESIADVPGLPPEQAEALRATALRRAAKRDELAGVRLIDPTAIFPRPPEGGDALVSGTPASGGRATGPARVIRDPAEFGELRRGDILVCPYTNPAWTPLFQRAAAVVVDSGGAGSHAAIVAREYGIPAVMGTGVATTELTSGRIVTVDGDVGEVSAAQDAPGATAVPAAKGGTEGGPS